MRIAARRDENEPALYKRATVTNGWTVEKVSSPGHPDWLCARDGVLKVVEVKMPGGKLTPAQEKVFPRLAAAGVPVEIVVTEEDVDRVLPPRPRRPVKHPAR